MYNDFKDALEALFAIALPIAISGAIFGVVVVAGLRGLITY